MSGLQGGSMLTPQMAAAASNLAAMGSGRDNMLAHINPREAQILMQLGGKGNLNPRTGIRQFDDGSGGGGDTTQSAPQTEGSAAANNAAPTLTPTGQFPTGQTWASMTAADPTSGGVTGLWQDPNSQQWYNPSGALAPLDPTQAANINTWFTNIAPVTEWDPINTDFAGGGFIPQPGDANFQLNAAGNYILSPTGDTNLQNQYNAEQQASIIQERNNQSGGLLPLEILGGVAGLAGGVAGLGALGAFGAADAGAVAGDLGTLAADVPSAGAGAATTAGAGALGTADAAAAGDVFDLGAAGTSIVPDAALGTAADPFAVGSAVTDATAGGVGDAFTGATTGADALGSGTLAALGSDPSLASGADATAGSTFGDAGSSLASLGANPSLGQLAAATPDSLVGEAAPDVAAGDTWDLPAAAEPAATDASVAGPSTDLATLDAADYPGGYILPPDPSTGLAAGATPATAAAGGGTVAGSGGGVGGWLSQVGSKLGAGLTNDLTDPFKLLGLGATGLGAISSLSGQNKNIGNVGANENALTNLATQTGATGTQLQSYLASGTLPPGLMQQVNQATASAIQNIKAKYAASGMGPNSTPEAQDVAKIQQNVAGTIATIGQQLLQSGTADLQLSEGTLQSLLTANTSLNNQTNQAIANLARALSGTGSGNQQSLSPSTTA